MPVRTYHPTTGNASCPNCVSPTLKRFLHASGAAWRFLVTNEAGTAAPRAHHDQGASAKPTLHRSLHQCPTTQPLHIHFTPRCLWGCIDTQAISTAAVCVSAPIC